MTSHLAPAPTLRSQPGDSVTNTDSQLVRVVGLGGLTASIVNFTIGAGIFVLPALVAAKIGAAAPVAYVVCAVAMALVVLCFAEAGSRVSATGGLYAYVETAFGPFVGFMVGMMLLASFVASGATIATFFATTMGQLFPVLTTAIGRTATILIVYAVFTVVNVRGVRTGTLVVNALTVAKLAPLLLLILLGAFIIHPANLAWPGVSLGKLGPASLVLIFAFTGVECALTPSGEVRDSARTVPHAVILALAVIALLYMALQIIAQGVLGADLARDSAAPLAGVATRAIGNGGRVFVLIAMAVSGAGYLSGDMLASPRAFYALGRDRMLPPVLARIHPRFRTPYVAVLLYAAISVALAVTGTFERLVVLSTVATLIVYLMCCLATLALRRRNVTSGGPPFVLPGGPVIPVLACCVVAWLLSSASAVEFEAVAGIIAVSALLYAAGIPGRARA